MLCFISLLIMTDRKSENQSSENSVQFLLQLEPPLQNLKLNFKKLHFLRGSEFQHLYTGLPKVNQLQT
jgi:hypothetical protein